MTGDDDSEFDGLDLGRLLRADDSGTNGRVDADAVIRRARRRRGTKIAGLATAWVLAGTVVIGAGAIGVRQLAGMGSGSSASSASGGARPADGTVPKSAPSATSTGIPAPNCGSPAPTPTATADGLAISVRMPGTVRAGQAITARVVLTNSGTGVIAATVESPRMAIVSAGVVTWHSPVVPTVSPRKIRLSPGGSITLAGRVVADYCATDKDAATTLPAAVTGSYQVLASIVVHLPAGDEVVVGRSVQLRVR